MRALPWLEHLQQLEPCHAEGSSSFFVISLTLTSWDVVTWPEATQHCVRGSLLKLRCSCSARECHHRTAVEKEAENAMDDLPDGLPETHVPPDGDFKALQPYSRRIRLIAGSPRAAPQLLVATTDTASYVVTATMPSTVSARLVQNWPCWTRLQCHLIPLAGRLRLTGRLFVRLPV